MATGILIFGANGSGKTTLGRELAQKLDCKRVDAEDYYFLPSEIPYTASRTKDEAARLMLADIEKCGDFVLSAVTGDFGEEITAKYSFAALISAPREIRLERIRRRAVDKFGARVLPGGDMYENNQRFIEFAANRPLDRIDRFAETLSCPLALMDGTKPVGRLLAEIEDFMRRSALQNAL